MLDNMSFEALLVKNLDTIRDRITTLKHREEEQQAVYRELNARRKRREITADEFSAEYAPINDERSRLYTERLQAETELRLARIESINSETQKDEKMLAVDRLVETEEMADIITSNIQKGGSNAQGVYEIKDREDLIAIQKSSTTYQYVGELPALMASLKDDARIPRVLKTFQKGEVTWMIAEKAKGKECSEIMKERGVDFFRSIPEEHFVNLIGDIRRLNEAGLHIDPSKHSNVFYDPVVGFSIIDIGYDYDKEMEERKQRQSQVDVKEVSAFITGSSDSEETEFVRGRLGKIIGTVDIEG